MKLKTTVRYSKSVETVNANGLHEWVGIDLIEEHDGETDRDEIHKDIVNKVKEWHRDVVAKEVFGNMPPAYSETLPVIQEKDR
jgi:hypothetical protein